MLNILDIPHRSLVWLDATEQKYKFKISQGNLVLENENQEILTRLNKHKVFAIFVVGHISLTSVMLDYCQKNAIPIVILGRNFRPILTVSNSAEANYLLRLRQFECHQTETKALKIAQHLIFNKIKNQSLNLKNIRNKSEQQKEAFESCKKWSTEVYRSENLQQLMGIEGNAAKIYFKSFFLDQNWQGRQPRVRLDPLNTVLDMGYSYLFNYIECFVKLFGFDPYIGVLHQTWFKRKSLVCDLVEPFRVIIDHQVRKSFNLKQFSEQHFLCHKQQYQLNPKYIKQYSQVLFEQLVKHKQEIYLYIRNYYRAFMKEQFNPELFPVFEFQATELDDIVIEGELC